MSDKILKRQSKYQGAKATDTLQMSQIHHLYTLCEENNFAAFTEHLFQ